MNKNELKMPTFAILFGGRGEERHISELSAAALIKKAECAGREPLKIGITPGGDWFIYLGDSEGVKDGSWISRPDSLISTYPVRLAGVSGFLADGCITEVEYVLPMLHGRFGEDGVLQGALETASIPYVGCDVTSGALSFDKAYTKLVAESVGVPCVPWVLLVNGGSHDTVRGRTAFSLEDATELAEKLISYPVFVKPAAEGSSIGASRADDRDGLVRSLREALAYGPRVLIEKALTDKREIECAYFDGAGGEIFAHPWQIRADGGFYDFERKYKSGAHLERADISPSDLGLVREYSSLLKTALGIRDISRFDYFLTPDGSLYFNEVNTMPGFTDSSLYPVMLSDEGVGTADLLSRLSEIARGRRI